MVIAGVLSATFLGTTIGAGAQVYMRCRSDSLSKKIAGGIFGQLNKANWSKTGMLNVIVCLSSMSLYALFPMSAEASLFVASLLFFSGCFIGLKICGALFMLWDKFVEPMRECMEKVGERFGYVGHLVRQATNQIEESVGTMNGHFQSLNNVFVLPENVAKALDANQTIYDYANIVKEEDKQWEQCKNQYEVQIQKYEKSKEEVKQKIQANETNVSVIEKIQTVITNAQEKMQKNDAKLQNKQVSDRACIDFIDNVFGAEARALQLWDQATKDIPLGFSAYLGVHLSEEVEEECVANEESLIPQRVSNPTGEEEARQLEFAKKYPEQAQMMAEALQYFQKAKKLKIEELLGKGSQETSENQFQLAKEKVELFSKQMETVKLEDQEQAKASEEQSNIGRVAWGVANIIKGAGYLANIMLASNYEGASFIS